jgi:flagellar FliJ protein
MPKFVFKLEGVLKQRKHAERQRLLELGVIQKDMTRLQENLRTLDQTVRDAEKDLRENRMTGKLDLAFLAAHRRFAFSMQRKAMALAEQMAGVKIKVDEAQKKLTDAVKRRKAIEKLREKQLERWREDLARAEIHEMDEVAMQMGRQVFLADQEAGAT